MPSVLHNIKLRESLSLFRDAKIYLLFLAVFDLLFWLLYFMLGFSSDAYADVFYYFHLGFILLLLALLYLCASRRGLLTPVGYFILSLLAFILARPLLGVISDIQYVEAGYTESFLGVVRAIAWVNLAVAFTSLGFCAIRNPLFFRALPVFIPSLPTLSALFLCLATGLLSVFLFISYQKAKVLGEIDYFSALDGDFHSHFAFFFIAKLLVLVSLFFNASRNALLVSSLLVFLGSIGFLILGLRGYTIAYFFLFMFFLNERWTVNKLLLGGCFLGIIYVAGLVLEYRVGYSVYEGAWDILYKVLYQQGATFEVLYGMASFPEAVRECIPYTDFFLGADFGRCVDTARGVFWEEGGFASSFFAESLYLGGVAFMVLCFLVGICLKFLDSAADVRRAGRDFTFNDYRMMGILLFSVIPNLVYFSRASAFDLVSKTASMVVLLVVAGLLGRIVFARGKQDSQVQ